jgi:hypothetical protein
MRAGLWVVCLSVSETMSENMSVVCTGEVEHDKMSTWLPT